jgi:hypothetical protein
MLAHRQAILTKGFMIFFRNYRWHKRRNNGVVPLNIVYAGKYIVMVIAIFAPLMIHNGMHTINIF